MPIHSCRNLISLYLKNPNPLFPCKPHVSVPFSLLFSSSSSSGQPRPNGSIPLADYLLHRHQFSPEVVSKVSSSVKYLKSPEKSDSILLFLKQSGFSKTHIEHVVKHVPIVLSANLDRTLKPNIKVFLDLGFSTSDVVEIVLADPWILTRNAPSQLGRSLLALKSVLGSNEAVSRALKISGWFLKFDLEKTMIPNIEFMESCGISSRQLVKFLYNFPRFFLYKHERLREFVKRVDELGFNRNSKTFLHAIRVISSMTVESWERKLELFRSLGFSEDEISSLFRKAPQVFAVSEKKIKEILQVLLGTGKFDTFSIINHPGMLIYSFEKRIKPRLRVMETLESKNLLLKWPSCAAMFKISDKRFFEKFVLPYSDEVGEMYNP